MRNDPSLVHMRHYAAKHGEGPAGMMKSQSHAGIQIVGSGQDYSKFSQKAQRQQAQDHYLNRQSQRVPVSNSVEFGQVNIRPNHSLLTPQRAMLANKLPPLAIREEFDSFNNAQFNTIVIGQ